jgi:imidazolonepropionase-like amidohydrolase
MRLALHIATICALVAGCSAPDESAQKPSTGKVNAEEQLTQPGAVLVVLEGATLIDGTRARSLEDSVIVLEGNRILRVGQVGDFDYPEHASVTDVSGRFIVPGFINTHAHMFETFPKPLLAFGITTVRNPGSGAEEGIPGASLGISLRDRLDSGEIVGPRMLTAGPIINNSTVFTAAPADATAEDTGAGTNYAEVRSEEDVRAGVRRQAAEGYDFIKLYMGIEPHLLRAAVDEAHTHDIEVIGHLKTTGWTAAAASGVDGLMHSCSEGPTWELMEPSVRDTYEWNTWPVSLRSWAATAEAIALEGPLWEALIEALVANGTEVNPTLATLEALYWADDAAHLAGEQPDFAPEGYAARWRDHWESQSNFMAAQGFAYADFTAFKAAFPACQKMIGAMHARGVLLTAGDDVGGWMTPGVSFHRELQLLAEAGISNMDVIQIATRNGAEALGILDEVGTIEPGKRADLVILEQDPIADIRNTQSIVTVIHDGIAHAPQELLRD